LSIRPDGKSKRLFAGFGVNLRCSSQCDCGSKKGSSVHFRSGIRFDPVFA